VGTCEQRPPFDDPSLSVAEGLSRLDEATKLVREDRRLWVFRLFPDAGEGGGSWVWVGRQTGPPEGLVPDVERARTEAERRARSKLRRYVAANRLTRLITLTYPGEGLHDAKVLRRDVGVFIRRLRKETGGGSFPYVWVPEWHKLGHGLHLHVAAGSYIPKAVIESSWGHGFVDVRLLRSHHVRGALAQSRAAAGYLSKYVGKGFDENRVPGLHRYEVAEGFQPRSIQLFGRDRVEVLVQALGAMGGYRLDRTWYSERQSDWKGPPAMWLSFAERSR
jgi:hypothetical protein